MMAEKLSVAAAGLAVSSLLSSDTTWLFEDDDDLPPEFVKECNSKPKVYGFAERIVPSYTDMDFRSHFRLRRADVEAMIVKLPTPDKTPGRPPVSTEKMVLLSIWVLANEETFRGVATRFGLERGHAHRLFTKFCDGLTRMSGDYIKWPSASDAATTLGEFVELRGPTGFPGVFGCVDGTHIAIRAPPQDSGSYYNRKGFHSILLQVVCDARFRFIDCFAGWPGSANDARVWSNSPISQSLVANPDIMPVNSHLLGDSAYPLQTYLMTPYRDNGHLTSKQKNFNVKLSSKRVVVEQAIGLLKNRFRRLRYLDVATPQFAAQMTMTACILHNICLRDPDADNELMMEDGVNDVEPESDNSQSVLYSLASRKRDAIADAL